MHLHNKLEKIVGALAIAAIFASFASYPINETNKKPLENIREYISEKLENYNCLPAFYDHSILDFCDTMNE
jgi:hypothetical protein